MKKEKKQNDLRYSFVVYNIYSSYIYKYIMNRFVYIDCELLLNIKIWDFFCDVFFEITNLISDSTWSNGYGGMLNMRQKANPINDENDWYCNNYSVAELRLATILFVWDDEIFYYMI